MGGALAAGARRHQRSLGELSVWTGAGWAARRRLERADSPKLAALLRHGAHVDHGHLSHSIYCLDRLFFLEAGAVSMRRRVRRSRTESTRQNAFLRGISQAGPQSRWGF